VRESMAAAERTYAALGASEMLSFLLEIDAAHEVTPEAHDAALQWFVRWLLPN
jgi:hypothetical protein